MTLTIDQAEALLEHIAEPFPEVLFEGLNGGVSLLEDTVPDPELPEVYILGEYRDDCLGRYINLYFGSFAALAGSGSLGISGASGRYSTRDSPSAL